MVAELTPRHTVGLQIVCQRLEGFTGREGGLYRCGKAGQPTTEFRLHCCTHRSAGGGLGLLDTAGLQLHCGLVIDDCALDVGKLLDLRGADVDRFIAEQGCHTGAHARSWHVGELALHTALVAVELALTDGVPTKTHVLNLLHRLVDGKTTSSPPVDTPQALALRREPRADVERYDDLRACSIGGRHAS